MKKQLTAALAVLLGAASLAACGSSQESAQKEDTVAESQGSESAKSGEGSSGSSALIMAWWGNQVRNERTQQVLDLYAEQNPGITIEGQFSEFNDYWNKLATAAAGHAMPDIVQMDYKYLEQ